MFSSQELPAISAVQNMDVEPVLKVAVGLPMGDMDGLKVASGDAIFEAARSRKSALYTIKACNG